MRFNRWKTKFVQEKENIRQSSSQYVPLAKVDWLLIDTPSPNSPGKEAHKTTLQSLENMPRSSRVRTSWNLKAKCTQAILIEYHLPPFSIKPATRKSQNPITLPHVVLHVASMARLSPDSYLHFGPLSYKRRLTCRAWGIHETTI